MWITLFSVTLATAICLSAAAVLLQRVRYFPHEWLTTAGCAGPRFGHIAERDSHLHPQILGRSIGDV